MEKFKLSESIKTERIVMLKRAHEHGLEMWQAIEESRSFIREYLFWVDKTRLFEDVVKTTDMFSGFWEEDKEWCYNIYSLENHRLLGCIGIHNINFMNQSAEIGYWLHLSETHKGYMTEAVKAMEEALFAAGIHRISIMCDVKNNNSSNVAKRAGYELESICKEALYHYTGLHDCAVYVKLSPYPVIGFD